MRRRVRLQITERSLSLVYESQISLRSLGSDLTYHGRILRRPSPLESNLELHFTRIVSIVEIFVDQMSELLFQQALDPATKPAARQAVEEAHLRSSSTWQERSRALKDYHGISIGTCSRWSEFDAAIAVRNAIAHGLGVLTPKQRNSATRNKIRSLGIEIVDGRVIVTSKAVDKLVEVSAEFMCSLDERCQGF